jgi:aryl-alcohol dehydrogenase-like predicted oxidoreductase
VIKLETRQLGNTGLTVSRLGVGLNEIGHLSLGDEATAARVLTLALDKGVSFFDTAACYGSSEELVGRAVRGRRHEFVLSTKAGHAVGDYAGPSWTAETVRDSIERSLRRMRTDYLDLVHLHSCSVAVLERGDVIQALQDAKEAGKTRNIGYSGDNEAAAWAVESGLFDTLETSFNLVDQRARIRLFDRAESQGMGIIAKRPIANAAWGVESSPSGYAAEYHRRAQIMIQEGPIPDVPDDPILLALGFVLAHEAVDTAIVGTRDPEHMQANIRVVDEELPIAEAAVEEIRRRFEELGTGWSQQT